MIKKGLQEIVIETLDRKISRLKEINKKYDSGYSPSWVGAIGCGSERIFKTLHKLFPKRPREDKFDKILGDLSRGYIEQIVWSYNRNTGNADFKDDDDYKYALGAECQPTIPNGKGKFKDYGYAPRAKKTQ